MEWWSNGVEFTPIQHSFYSNTPDTPFLLPVFRIGTPNRSWSGRDVFLSPKRSLMTKHQRCVNHKSRAQLRIWDTKRLWSPIGAKSIMRIKGFININTSTNIVSQEILTEGILVVMFNLYKIGANYDFAPMALSIFDLFSSGLLPPEAIDSRPVGAFSTKN